MELKAKVRATSTRGVRSAEIDENGDLIFTMTDGETLNLGAVIARGIQGVEVLETGELQITYTDGTSEVIGDDVYSAIEALAEAAQDAAEAAEAAAATLTLDDTLTIQGAGAEAKATGEAIANAVGNRYRATLPLAGSWDQGTLATADGTENNLGTNNTTRIRSAILDKSATTVTIGTGYKIRLYAYASNGDYIGVWNGTTFEKAVPSSDLTGTIDLTVWPDYHFRLVCLKGSGSSAISAAEGQNILVSAEYYNPDTTAEDGLRKYNAMTNGHIRYFNDLSGVPLDIYDSNNVVTRTVSGSAYIKLYNKDIINFLVKSGGNISYPDSAFYIYFYDSGKHIAWDILDYTDPVTGEKNRFTEATLKGLNGLQFSGIPGGYYIRVSAINACGLALAIWDSIKFGIEMSAYSTVLKVDENGDLIEEGGVAQREALPEDGRCTVALPTYGNYAIARPGYTFLRGFSGYDIRQMTKTRFPTQVVPLTGIYGNNSGKNLELVQNYNYSDGTYDKVCLAGNVSDYVVLLDFSNSFSVEKPAITAHRRTLEKANLLTKNFKWTTAAAMGATGNGTFPAGCQYSGVPYRSAWSTACYVGWHTTKNTFMNAANDPNSIFYQHNHANMGPYYSLVCSSFGTLVTGQQYPETNFGLIRDPNYGYYKAKRPPVGELVTNGYGHCIVPLRIFNSNESDLYAYNLAESGAPYAREKTLYPTILQAWDGVGSNSTYADNYNVVMYPLNHVAAAPDTPYNVEDHVVIVNGSARPYKGNQSVYTTGEAVKINIYDPDANRLYYQKFTVSTSRGIITSATPASGTTPQYIDIEPGEAGRTVTLRSSGSSSYTGEQLENGAVYGVWASVDDAQSTPPTGENGSVLTGTEFFEWYDRGVNGITYNITDGELFTDDDFWYAVIMAYNNIDVYNPIKNSDGTYKYSGGLVSIPYEPKKRTSMIAGKDDLEAHCDYSKYRERYYLYRKNNGVSVDPVWAFFRKGKLGAYVMLGTESDDPYDEDPVD